jgi:hypothetical protein
MDDRTIWLAAGLRTPFVGVDGPFAHRDSLALSVPVVRAMAPLATGQIDFAIWGAVVGNLAYANLAREVWLEAKLNPHVPTFTTIMQCSTSMVGVFEAAGILGSGGGRSLALVGGVESMTRVQIGLGQNLSDWLRRVVQARSFSQRLSVLRKLRPSDIRLFVPEVKNRVTGRSMGSIPKTWQRPGISAGLNKMSWRCKVTATLSPRRLAGFLQTSSCQLTGFQPITFPVAIPRSTSLASSNLYSTGQAGKVR